MRFSSPASVSTCAVLLSPFRNIRHMALAISVSALSVGGAVLAADKPASKSDAAPAADTVAAPDAAKDPGVLPRAETGPTPETTPVGTHGDRSQEAAKSRKASKQHKTAATPESAPTSVPPTTAQVVPEDRVCHLEQAPGSRVRKTVCTTASEEDAKAKNGQEYLKRAYEDSIHPSPNPSTFTQAGR